MAPSPRTRTVQQQPRLPVPAFRVTKSSRLNERPIAKHKPKIDALENAISENALTPSTIKVAPSLESSEAPTTPSKKRRRESNTPDSEPDRSINDTGSKRIKKNIVFPKIRKECVHQEHEERQLPATLWELIQLHKHFMHALSVHYAHNKGGIRDVIDLAALLPTMTRLWKKRTVNFQDIQRILALWELEHITQLDQLSYDTELPRVKGPFRIEQVGIGLTSTTTLEYTWTERSDTFIETELQQQYEEAVQRLFTTYIKKSRNAEVDAFIWRDLNDVPKLQCEMSQTTQARKEKVASIKSQILSKKPISTIQQQQQPDLSNLSLHGPDSPPRPALPKTVRSRTMDLFDRVRAKQLFNSTAALVTPAQLVRQRALQRIPDLVDVLRLKQARKLTGQTYEVQSSMSLAQMKVSFSFEALVQEIRDSLRTEVASDEIREGLLILGKEMPGGWCTVYEMGSVRCVTLQGEAMGRVATEAWCKSLVKLTTA